MYRSNFSFKATGYKFIAVKFLVIGCLDMNISTGLIFWITQTS